MAATILEALREGGIGLVDARALFRGILGSGHFAPDLPLTDAQHAAFLEQAARRRAGEPVAYLTGEREFYSLAIKVTPAVLIPRPETELLVDAALELIAADVPVRVLDLATGSGCVAVAIGRHRARARVTATDISRDALAVARGNAEAHGVDIEFIESDWFSALSGRRFDLIVSNPPYVAEGDPHLNSGDLRFEPRSALVAGTDGLACIGSIVALASKHLVSGGWLLLEHGFDQAARCRNLLQHTGFEHVVSKRDLAAIERITVGRRGAAKDLR